MPGKPENWDELTPEEKRTLRLDAWVRGDGIKFDNSEAEAKYNERATLLRDAVELKKPPARVPIADMGGGYALRRVGIPQKAAMYDRWEEAAQAMIKYHMDFEPDCAPFPHLMSGASMELLDQTNMKWAGHGLPDDVQYQYLEQEYMKADEYSDFLDDPSDFVLRRYLPRVNRALKGLQKLSKFSVDGIGFGGAFLRSFRDPEVLEALDILKKAAELSSLPMIVKFNAMRRFHAMGFPSFASSFSRAPYDVLGDSLRGTIGIMMDLYRHPDRVVAACDKVLALMPVPEVPMGAAPFILMLLHKGADNFMSREHFEKFYWPTFKQTMLRMIDEGLMPLAFAQGGYNHRLEYITELPKGATVWFFDQTDMHRAKDLLGDVCCIMGNVPITEIATGTADQVKVYCKDLIDYCGKDGGYILSPGSQIDDGQEETIKAMIDFTKEYGVYS